jgi:hypothetical protein
LLEKELTRQSSSDRAMQLQHGENKNRLDLLAQTGGEFPQVPIAAYPMDKSLESRL